jgi:acetyl esterase/lipase
MALQRALPFTLVLIALAAGARPHAQGTIGPPSPCYKVRGTSVTRHTNLVYQGEHWNQVLDLYLPVQRAPCAPTVLFLHGGGWSWDASGLRKDQPFVVAMCTSLASNGIPVVSANYYLSVYDPCFTCDASNAYRCDPASANPLQTIRDTKWVVDWIRDPVNGLPDSLVVTGTSAGGHLAALLATTETEATFNPVPGNDYTVDLAVLFSPPLLFARMGCDGIPRPDCGPCDSCDPIIRNDPVPPGYPCNPVGEDSVFQERFLGLLWDPSQPPLSIGSTSYGCGDYPGHPDVPGTVFPSMPTSNPWYDASPYFWISGDEPPVYIFQSECDGWVSARESADFQARMGPKCHLETYSAETACDLGCRHSMETLGTPTSIANTIRARVELHLY